MNLLAIIGVFLLGCLESIFTTAGVISQAKGWARSAAVISFLNIAVFFLSMKVAMEISFLLLIPYALAFSLGTYLTVKVAASKKYRRLWRRFFN